MRNLIFLEGPAYAGKTTYLQRRDSSIVEILLEASEFLGGDSHFPDAPHDVESMIRCSYFFIFMENERFARVSSGPTDKPTVMADRFTPLSSMLFYGLRHRKGAINADDYLTGIQLCSKIFQDNLQLPNTAFRHRFLLFTVGSEADFLKRLSRGTRNQDFNDWDNFQFLVELYRNILPDTTEEIGGHEPSKSRYGWNEDSQTLKELLRPEHFLPQGVALTPLTDSAMQAAINNFITQEEIEAVRTRVKGLTV